MESGSLGNRGIADILRALREREETGCLHVERDQQRASVWLRSGLVYTAQAPEARARLGDRLVGAGELDQAALDAALEAQRAAHEHRRIGELLMDRGVIDPETLRRYVREQILDSVTATLGWREGSWRFEPGAEAAEDAPLEMSTENLLMHATRRLEEWEVIRSALGSMDAVVDFAPRESGAEVALTPDEWSLMTQIDGRASVAEIAEEAGYGQFETARIIYGLLAAGIVQVTPEEERAGARDIDREALLSEFAALGDVDRPRPIARRSDAAEQRRTSLPPPSTEERRRLRNRFRKQE